MELVYALHNLPRTGWINRGVENSETVGQHNDELDLLAEKVCEERPDLDKKKLKTMLLVHDWPEYIWGDQVTAVEDPELRKKLLAIKKTGETLSMELLAKQLGSEYGDVLSLWKEYEEIKTPEAVMAKQLDKFQSIVKAWEYEKSNNGKVRTYDFIDYYREAITEPLLVSWLAELEEEIKNTKSALK